MRESTRFHILGEVIDITEETYNEFTRTSIILRVHMAQDKVPQFKVGVFGDELCGVARQCKGRHVLVIGRLSGGVGKAGYYNTYMSADAILVEPAASRGASYGAASQAPHQQAKANGYQPQPKPEDPLPWESGTENDDIPF